MSNIQRLKTEIITALSHPDADEGLYFRNFFNVHEEDDRQAISGDEDEVLDALRELISEGLVVMDDGESEPIFTLQRA